MYLPSLFLFRESPPLLTSYPVHLPRGKDVCHVRVCAFVCDTACHADTLPLNCGRPGLNFIDLLYLQTGRSDEECRMQSSPFDLLGLDVGSLWCSFPLCSLFGFSHPSSLLVHPPDFTHPQLCPTALLFLKPCPQWT